MSIMMIAQFKAGAMVMKMPGLRAAADAATAVGESTAESDAERLSNRMVAQQGSI